MQTKDPIYSGKTKSFYETDDPNQLIMTFRNDATAFNLKKHAILQNKGKVNNHFNAFIMRKLSSQAIDTHFIKLLSECESLVKRLEMLPVECIVRNIAAGSLCKRLGIQLGTQLPSPIFEFFYKNDALDDPMINDCHVVTFGWATQSEIEQMKALSLAVNEVLYPLFYDAGMLLVDYKLEFGRLAGKVVLGDEFTPDGCRIWDKDTHEILDKDRFRQDLGNVVESYEIAAAKLGVEYS